MSYNLDEMIRIIQPLDLRFSKEIDVQIDLFTPCLKHRESGEIYETEWKLVKHQELKEIVPKNGWNDFNWELYVDNSNCKIVKLMIKGDFQIQGLIAYESKEGWVEVHLVESAPWNVKDKLFYGVGAHLFAIACKESFELGFDGYVSFVSKTGLVSHYIDTLQVTVLNPRTRQLVIDTIATKRLVSTYFKGMI